MIWGGSRHKNEKKAHVVFRHFALARRRELEVLPEFECDSMTKCRLSFPSGSSTGMAVEEKRGRSGMLPPKVVL